MKLRDYQTRSIDMLYDWMSKNEGNPCVVLPTGAGKSVVIAEFIKGAVQEWPETKALMLCAQKEILEQNAEKMRAFWPAAPMGIYHAGMRRRDLGEPITFAGIQSVRSRAADVGHVDLCICDEAHQIGHEDEGTFRKFIGELLAINSAMRVVGFSGTPYRLGHGYITDKPALFDALIEPVSIEELLHKGYLSPLTCKATRKKYDTVGLHTRGGEFVESELQRLVDTDEQNAVVADEIIANGDGRKSWLVFCTGVEHARHMAAALTARGIVTECVTGETPKAERERMLKDFKSGKIQAMTNANVLTTGFDAPGIDLIAFCRPTLSVSLYMQMAGRGLRVAPGKKDCLVLDFAGLVSQHGVITNPRVKRGKGEGDAPVKVCDECAELCHIAAENCPACGWLFPVKEKEAAVVAPELEEVDMVFGVNPDDVVRMKVTDWKWDLATSAKSGKQMIVCTYYGALSDKPVKDYFTVFHDGYAGDKAWRKLITIATKLASWVPAEVFTTSDPVAIIDAMNAAPSPDEVHYTVEKFATVTRRVWP